MNSVGDCDSNPWIGKMRMIEDGNAWAEVSKLEELINSERLAIWS